MLTHILRLLRQRRASHKLDHIVRTTAESYEIRRYRERRAAAKLGHARKRGAA